MHLTSRIIFLLFTYELPMFGIYYWNVIIRQWSWKYAHYFQLIITFLNLLFTLLDFFLRFNSICPNLKYGGHMDHIWIFLCCSMSTALGLYFYMKYEWFFFYWYMEEEYVIEFKISLCAKYLYIKGQLLWSTDY